MYGVIKLYNDYTNEPFSFIMNNATRQTANILALSSGNTGKYEFLTDKHLLLGKDFLEKAHTVKRFEYSLSDSQLKSKLVLQKNNFADEI